jgi:UDP-N-acetylmuramoyl-tripeptide--D-alanyl-D-alanine ligase
MERSRTRRPPRALRRAHGGWRHAVRVALAWVWRRLMFRTTVVAVTGSVGKTTAKECLAAVLAAGGPTLKTLDNQNDGPGVPRTLLRLRPWHRFAVIEVGTATPGLIARSARLVKPHVAVVLNVARTHTDVFPTLEATAAEKAALVAALPRRGTAILNGDDERVRAMAERCPARVVWFGQKPDCDWVAEDVRSGWPERLRFRVRAGRDVALVRTQLVGAHWVSSVLSALAAGHACGAPLAEAAAALAGVAPFTARMQPVALPGGVVVIRDEETGSPDSLRAMLDVMRGARARRRVLVWSDLTDSKAKPRKRQRDMGRLAAELAHAAIFVGDHAHHAVRAAVGAGMDSAACHAATTVADAARRLGHELREGDLVFLKGRATDHLSRVLFAQLGPIGCWKSRCRVRSVCDLCWVLRPGFDLAQALAAPLPPASGA